MEPQRTNGNFAHRYGKRVGSGCATWPPGCGRHPPPLPFGADLLPFAAINSLGTMDVRIRTVLPSESTLIFSFLTLAARMPESGEPIQKALADHELTRYWRNWGREGDLGVVAESETVGYPIACAWVRLFSREEAGADFVGEDIPELAIGTIPTARGLGVGTRVLQALLSLCRTRYSGVSLSVRLDNPAVRLYERFGFRRTSQRPIINRVGTESTVMLLGFDESVPGE